MKKILYIALLFNVLLSLNAQVLNFTSKENETEISTIEKEIENLRNEIKELKQKTSFLDFTLTGGTKITWGINFPDNPFAFLANSNVSKPPVHGFDFENTLSLGLNLNNSSIIKSNTDNDFSEILFKFKMKTLRPVPYNYKPSGDYYAVNAVDQDGNPKTIYFPVNDDGGNDLIIGNFELILEQAKLSNILGTGFFINYADVTKVSDYYGIEPLIEVIKLNHSVFNHGFSGKGKSLWLSFDYGDFEPETYISEAVDLWSSSDLNDSAEPHGFSLGYDNYITDQFHFLFEAGIASKDNFDAENVKDDQIDYGFFLKACPTFDTKQFIFNPKLHFGTAFQTQTQKDYSSDWATINFAFDLPVKLLISDKDSLGLELSTNWKRHIALSDSAFLFGLVPSLTLMKGSLTISLPIQYWYKDGIGGFAGVENETGTLYEHTQEEHVFNGGLEIEFTSLNLFSDNFTYTVSNDSYFTTAFRVENEYFFHNLLKNKFVFYNVPFLGSYVTMESFVLYTDIGFGIARNMRYTEYFPLSASEIIRIPSVKRYDGLSVFYGEFGFIMNFTRNMAVGFSTATPKINLDLHDTIGIQNTYTTIKIWSEIKL